MLDGRHVLQVGSNTVRRVTAIGAGDSIVIPTLSNGNKPKWVWLVSVIDALVSIARGATVSPEHSSGTGSVGQDIPLIIGGRGVYLNVWGYSHIHVDFMAGGTGSQAQVYVVPLENQ